MVNLFLIQNLLCQKFIFKLNITFHALKHNSLLNKNKNISQRALKKKKDKSLCKLLSKDNKTKLSFGDWMKP